MSEQPCTCNKENRAAEQHSSHCLAAQQPQIEDSPWREWTNVHVEELLEKGGSMAVRDAHNAELTAEREKWTEAIAQGRLYFEQLAAEREKVKSQVDALERITKLYGQIKAKRIAADALAKA